MKQWNDCVTVAEFADNAALYERDQKKAVQNGNSRNPNDILLRLPLTYLRSYANEGMELYQDVYVMVESYKASWELLKNGIMNTDTLQRHISKSRLYAQLNHITTVSHYILDVGHNISRQTKKPTVVIYNARGASIYSYLLEDCCEWVEKGGARKKVPVSSLNLDEVSAAISMGQEDSCVIPLRDFKISSHEYVQTEEEALKLSGPHPLATKLRKSYLSKLEQNKEFIPDIFLDYLRKGFSLVFVDIPAWGKYYASSTGVLRNQKDLLKQKQGIYKPYKFKSYVEYARYQVVCVSLQKLLTADDPEKISIAEEDYKQINIKHPLALILNPENSWDIWWDNCPQLLGAEWAAYSNISIQTIKEEYPRISVDTNLGMMDIAEYIKQWIKGAKIVNEIDL